MLTTKQIGSVTKIKMARSIAGRPLYTTNAYLVDGLLLDTGLRHVEKEFEAFVKGQKIDTCVISHHHEDHSGNGAVVQNALGITPLSHPDMQKYLSQLKLRPYRKLVWGYPKPYATDTLPNTVETNNLKFKVIEAPGHAPDMIVLYEPDKGWLFSSDLYISPKVKILRLDEDVQMIMASLRKILELDFDTLFCSHRPVYKGGKEALKQKLEFFECLYQEAYYLYSKGLSLKQIRNRMLGSEGPFTLISTGHFTKLHLIESLLAPHLPDRKETPAIIN